MSQAFNRIFWGYLFVLVEIHLIFIDVLPDPVGYYLIFSGISLILKNFPIGHKAKNLAISLIFISIPSVFIQNIGTGQLGEFSFLSGGYLYLNVMNLLQLILVFFLFQLIMDVVQEYGDKGIIRRSSKTFTIYISAMLIITITHPFLINFSGDLLIALTIVTAIIGFTMQIVFLLLLRSLRKVMIE